MTLGFEDPRPKPAIECGLKLGSERTLLYPRQRALITDRSTLQSRPAIDSGIEFCNERRPTLRGLRYAVDLETKTAGVGVGWDKR